MSFTRKLALLLIATFGTTVASAALKVKMGSHPDHAVSFNGGVFAAQGVTGFGPLPDISPNYFATFCIESSEFISYGAEYFVDIATSAKYGGSGGGVNGEDPLDPATAWLYTQYRLNPGALNTDGVVSAGGSFTGTQAQRQIATKMLQQAIWKIEQESPGVMNDLVTLATGKWTNIGNVRVMRLWQDAGLTLRSQDQLILIDNVIPAPAAIVLAIAGLGMIGAAKRRFGN